MPCCSGGGKLVGGGLISSVTGASGDLASVCPICGIGILILELRLVSHGSLYAHRLTTSTGLVCISFTSGKWGGKHRWRDLPEVFLASWWHR